MNVLLDRLPLAACLAMDSDRNGTVAVAELVRAVDAAIRGCPGSSPTATPTAVPLSGRCHANNECNSIEVCLEPGGYLGCGICYPDFVIDDWQRCSADADCEEREDAPICQPLGSASRTCSACSGPVSVCLPGCSEEAPCELGQVCQQHRCVAGGCDRAQDCPTTHACKLPDIAGLSAGDVVSGRECVRRACTNDGECGDGFCVEGACYTELGRCQLLPG